MKSLNRRSPPVRISRSSSGTGSGWRPSVPSKRPKFERRGFFTFRQRSRRANYCLAGRVVNRQAEVQSHPLPRRGLGGLDGRHERWLDSIPASDNAGSYSSVRPLRHRAAQELCKNAHQLAELHTRDAASYPQKRRATSMSRSPGRARLARNGKPRRLRRDVRRCASGLVFPPSGRCRP